MYATPFYACAIFSSHPSVIFPLASTPLFLFFGLSPPFPRPCPLLFSQCFPSTTFSSRTLLPSTSSLLPTSFAPIIRSLLTLIPQHLHRHSSLHLPSNNTTSRNNNAYSKQEKTKKKESNTNPVLLSPLSIFSPIIVLATLFPVHYSSVSSIHLSPIPILSHRHHGHRRKTPEICRTKQTSCRYPSLSSRRFRSLCHILGGHYRSFSRSL